MAGARNQVADWLNRVVQLHDRIIDRYGGAPGILDASLLKAAIERPWTGLADGTENYPGVFVKAAVLLERIINYHPFVDGNKRTATILVFEFLRRHGCVAVVESSEIVDVAVRIAEKKLQPPQIANWLERITPVRIRRFEETPPCPWCGSPEVAEFQQPYSQGGMVTVGGPTPPRHHRAYWSCGRCGVLYNSGSHVLTVGRVRLQLHVWGFGDPRELFGKVVMGPWWTEDDIPPSAPGRITITKSDVSSLAAKYPEKHLEEILEVLRQKDSGLRDELGT